MAIGKQSLGRVAKSGASASETVATSVAEPVKAEPSPAKKAIVQKPSVKVVKRPSNTVYAVGDKLPEYLL